jgi:acetyltransferase-like isoleucine patch superfamily enzyme
MGARFQRWLGLRLAKLIRDAESERERRVLSKLANSPKNLRVKSPLRVVNAGHISIGSDVSLGPGCLLTAIRRYPGRVFSDMPTDIQPQEFNPSIVIGDRVSATGYLTVSAAESVTIADDVILASYIFISDNSHGRSRVDIPYKDQPLTDILPVLIGKGCWISEHVVVMPGVSIGEYSIIGANSVVTSDIPSRSIAVGAPARVVKVWSDSESDWISPARSSRS